MLPIGLMLLIRMAPLLLIVLLFFKVSPCPCETKEMHKNFRRNTWTRRHRWEDNIKLIFEGVDWINVALISFQWRAVVNTVMNIWVP
jgi:hypothetical protein